MKERLLDVAKWGLILVIAGVVFYVMYPKYYFGKYGSSNRLFKGNKITGKVEYFSSWESGWRELRKSRKSISTPAPATPYSNKPLTLEEAYKIK